MWLEHLLLLSMLQHPAGMDVGPLRRRPPGRQLDFADACARYRDCSATVDVLLGTLEELLDAEALPAGTTTALRDRYLPRQA